ncbi:SMI1/KNR4 family protein [Bartonella raoultii]|uniref:SMI1/KNR4 family protein n=1 Tax=Bartonella raoultii TaxID=1457020 RepID=UPI001ABB0578|nr:SMI1/KNR4 family protein [Bartonella raoultii]
MKNFMLSDVEKLIDEYSEDINFGPTTDDIQIKKAEETIGLQFTSSYKSFLKNYGISEIGCDEILTVYWDCISDPAVCIPAGDIVYQNLNDIKKGFARPQQLIVCNNTFCEIIYFDYSQFHDGECPLYFRFPSGASYYYASNFYEFLYKRIKVNFK